MAMASGYDSETAPARVPEAEAAADSAAEMILQRVTAGRRQYGKANVEASASRLISMAREEVADCWAYLDWAQRRLAPQEGRLRVYIAGPYRGDTVEAVYQNITAARQAMGEVYRKGHSPFCPHTMTAFAEHLFPDLPDSVYLSTDIDWLGQCHALLLLPSWQCSTGARKEKERAEKLGLLIVSSVNLLPTPEEVRSGWSQ